MTNLGTNSNSITFRFVISDGVVVSNVAFHAGNPGSNPQITENYFFLILRRRNTGHYRSTAFLGSGLFMADYGVRRTDMDIRIGRRGVYRL